jgi:hypothetical protein
MSVHPWPHRDGAGTGIIGGTRWGAPTVVAIVVAGVIGAVVLVFPLPLPLPLTLTFVVVVGVGGRRGRSRLRTRRFLLNEDLHVIEPLV